MQHLLLFIIALIVPFAHQSPLSGTVELNSMSFNKLLKKFEATLIKFDVAYPYGDQHTAYTALAKDAVDVDNLLIAEVGVKDYGEKDNEDLALKYGITKDDFPAIRLFVRGKEEPIVFESSKQFTTDELRRFVSKNSGIHLSMAGCVKALDQVAIQFMKSKDEREKLLKKTEEMLPNLPTEDKASGKIYKLIMQKVLEKGDDFIQSELERVGKLLTGKLSAEKKKELTIRINILNTFKFNNDDKNIQDEL